MEIKTDNPKHFTIENVDLNAFINAIDACKGPVILYTDEGDRFNLKSKFSQILGFLNLVRGGQLTKAKVYCPDEDDETMLFRLGLFGEEPDKS